MVKSHVPHRVPYLDLLLDFAERARRAGADAGDADRGGDDVPAAPRHDGRRPRLRLQPQLCRPRGREEHVLGRHPQVYFLLHE